MAARHDVAVLNAREREMKQKRLYVLGALISFLVMSCAEITHIVAPIAETFQSEYSAKPVTLHVVDEETGAPIEGVIATANWELVTGSYAGGRVVRGQMKVLETISDRDGKVFFPAWGPEPNRYGGHLQANDPQMILYKSGYKPMRLNNFNKYGQTPDPNVPEGYSRDSVRISIWDGDTIRLTKATSRKYINLHTDLDGIETHLYFAFSDRSCDWKLIPRMTAVLLKERIIGQHNLNEGHCGTAETVLKGISK